MQNYQEQFDDEESSEELGEYEEGLDDDYDDEQYDEEGDLGSDDGEEYVEGEEDDDEEGDGYIRGLEQLPVRGAPDASRPWQGLDRLPATTKAKYVELLRKLQGNKKQNISILLLGKFSTGKSHTTNSLLNEEAAKKQFLNREGAPPLAHTREAHGFTLSIIDTGGLTETDVVSPSRLDSVGEYIASRPIDVVLYVDRFDYFRTDGNDRQVIQGISDYFGADIWRNAVVGLTHACQNDTSMPWEDFAEKRGEQIQAAIRKHGGCPDASLPVAFIENSESCKQNDDGESVLPNGLAWLPDLMEKVTDKAASTTPYTFNPEEVARKSDPNKKLKWLVPVLFAAQIAFKFLVFDKIMEDDKLTGDRHGPYDPAVVASKRRFKALEEERQKRAASARGGRAAQTSRRRRNYDSD